MDLIVIIILSIVGLILGLFLAISSEIFKVEVDPRLKKIEEALPGSNCGACGYPGCSGCAEAVLKEEAGVDVCPVGGSEASQLIAEILDKKIDDNKIKTAAYIHCKGMDEKNAPAKYEYVGIESCASANNLAGGWKQCSHGCLKLGDCIDVCNFGALKYDDKGKPVIDIEKCTSCELCIQTCPRNLISIIPLKRKKIFEISCMSKEKGGIVKKQCKTGCIGCKICVKSCKFEAIEVENFLAKINQDKCVSCGKCLKDCPTGVIEEFKITLKPKPKTANKPEQEVHCGKCPAGQK